MNTNKYNFISRASHLCNLCADDELRPVLNTIFFDEGNAVVTDGHVLFVVPIVEISNLEGADIAKLEGKLINKAAFKELLKFDKIIAVENDGICVEKTNFTTSYKVKIHFADDGVYPKYKSVMGIDPLPLSERISFKPSKLEEMCNVVGETMPILKPNGDDRISIDFRGSKAKGLLMQCRIDEVIED
jgi:hypothetical protein